MYICIPVLLLVFNNNKYNNNNNNNDGCVDLLPPSRMVITRLLLDYITT